MRSEGSACSTRSRRVAGLCAYHLALACLLAAELLGSGAAAAQAPARGSSPTPASAPSSAKGRVSSLLTGLVNPRGITFGPDGALYVAEAGAGGPDTPDIGARGRRYRVGYTARVSRVTVQGHWSTVLDGLPSLFNGDDELGATDVAFLGSTLYVLTATGGYGIGNPAFDNVLLRLGVGGAAARVFNLTEYNLASPARARVLDPSRTDVPGGMPFGLAALDGALFATDGNQEHVTRITPEGQAQRILEYPASDRVLTGLAAGPDGALYVAEFGPAPHRDGSALITRLTRDGQARPFIEGLVNAIDIAFGPDRLPYVLEFARPGVRIPWSGRVLRVTPRGEREVVVSGLNFPTSLAFGPDGNLYIANAGHRASQGAGEIVRVELRKADDLLVGPDALVPLVGALLLFALVGSAVLFFVYRPMKA